MLEEIIDFLELGSDLPHDQIVKKLFEKHRHYAMLEQNAPTDVLRNRYRQTLGNLNRYIAFMTTDAPHARQHKATPSAGQPLRAPSEPIRSQPYSPTPHEPKHEPAKGASAWLVRHTENMQTISFELREGTNVLGRNPSGPGNHILIENDRYVSRMHARIDMIPAYDGYRFELTDGFQSFAMKPSLNGTYRNGEHTRIQPERKVMLMDGDTIQIGETKFCLKVAPVNKKRIVEEEVASSDYVKTVVIKLQ